MIYSSSSSSSFLSLFSFCCDGLDTFSTTTTTPSPHAGISPAIANLYRRTMMMVVETVAIDVVLFYENDGVVFDEALAHRIGMVPLNIDASLLSPVVGKINTDNPDPATTLKFTIDVTADRDNYQVYSTDLVHVPLEGSPAFATPPSAVHKKILLAKLAKGNRIKAVCYAVKGCAEQHAKYSATACVTYKPVPIVRTIRDHKNGRGEAAEWIKERCPGKVFDIEDGVLVAARPEQCTMCRECIRTDRDETNPCPVQLGLAKSRFHFQVESIGVYTCEDIFRRAVTTYAGHLRRLSKDVQTTWPTQLVEDLDPMKEDYL